MSHSLLIAFVIFATVMFFTPGPNNVMLLSSGLTYGFRRTVPHLAGIVIGFAFMIGAVSTSIAYWLWGRLLRDYTAAQVVPFALLVPFVGAAASSIVFGERFGPLRLAGMITVVCGIAIMLLSKRPPAVPKIA